MWARPAAHNKQNNDAHLHFVSVGRLARWVSDVETRVGWI
jgi:hypothetical protein